MALKSEEQALNFDFGMRFIGNIRCYFIDYNALSPWAFNEKEKEN